VLFGSLLVLRLLYPFLDSPLAHLNSDPLRHWTDGRDFLHPTVMGGGDPYLYVGERTRLLPRTRMAHTAGRALEPDAPDAAT
jgi:hypothetical protein